MNKNIKNKQNTLTLWSNPIEHVKLAVSMAKASICVCGHPFGIFLLPNGKVVVTNTEILDIIERCLKPVEED